LGLVTIALVERHRLLDLPGGAQGRDDPRRTDHRPPRAVHARRIQPMQAALNIGNAHQDSIERFPMALR